MTAGALAAIAGTGAGAAIIDRLFQNIREKELNHELELARQEYLKGLTNKEASYLAELFSFDGLHKQADSAFGDKTFGLLNYPLAVTALLTILGSAGTSYVTKKVLDDKFKEEASKGLDMPKVKRIVFRTGTPTEKGEKLASADDITAIHACIGLLCDELSGDLKVAQSFDVANALPARGLNPGQFVGMTKDIHRLLAYLAQDPELSKLVERAAMDRHPVLKHLKWSLGIPFVKRIADRKLQAGLQSALTPPEFLAPALLKGRDIMQAGMEKQMAAMPITTGAMVAGMIGSGLTGGSDKDEVAAAVMEAEKLLEKQKSDEEQRKHPETAVAAIALQAKDPAAAAYVKGNREKIRKLLTRMVEEGTL
jgi:hypothetical protein